MDYSIGTDIEGEVTGIQPYGAFVSLDKDTQGLIHISEVKHGYIKNIQEVLEVGQKVKVKIIDIDMYTQKISLSLRVLDHAVPPTQYRRKKFFTNKNKKIGFESLKNILPVWVEEATELLSNE
ncbi:CvfD/Ygs/GSP13 family RNA-binding post-transcriptional regulator [Vagococcus entomophilus]|uniref:RNA-binding protein n=1 Tax=Vagococcus entomophilus TaxID=1160095 RepID=A0A430AHP8_9ENTE|nr:CvfD/Ygs/GSP13 family RNA-binding post-transcriptional regulator [Vagococcus entomophilus]RSU07393.1 RNA-binding protein [Vagococcus entomophilus]